MIDIYESIGLKEPKRSGAMDALWKDKLCLDEQHGIWKKAVRYVLHQFQLHEWDLLDTQLAEDHICFSGSDHGTSFVLYLFACGEQDTELLEREYFLQFATAPENEEKRVYVLYTRVAMASLFEPYDLGRNRRVLSARAVDNIDKRPELWVVEHVDGRGILTPYSAEKKFVLLDRLIAAFNAEDYDLVNSLLTRKCRAELPVSTYIDVQDSYEFFEVLHKLSGKMRPAYIRRGEYTFTKTACLERGNFLTPLLDKYEQIDRFSFDGSDEPFLEVLVSNETPMTHPLNTYPQLCSIRCIPHRWERFCLELSFENGEVKEYTLPTEGVGDEVALVEGYSFTDRIFYYARLVDSSPDPEQRTYLDQRSRGQRIVFANGYSISTPELYFASPTELSDASICIIE